MQDPDKASQAPGGALGRLLELEEGILERSARAREESDFDVARARAEAELGKRRLAEQIVEDARALGLRVEAEHASELRDIAEAARREAEELESCDEVRMAKLADALVEYLLDTAR
jgi:hypothetical protein